MQSFFPRKRLCNSRSNQPSSPQRVSRESSSKWLAGLAELQHTPNPHADELGDVVRCYLKPSCETAGSERADEQQSAFGPSAHNSLFLISHSSICFCCSRQQSEEKAFLSCKDFSPLSALTVPEHRKYLIVFFFFFQFPILKKRDYFLNNSLHSNS